MLDPKYKTEADQDSIFKETKEGAQMTLGMLKDEAKEKEADMKKIVETLITVSNTLTAFDCSTIRPAG